MRQPQHVITYPLPPGFNGRLALLYRWFSGRPLNGHRYTDATGFRYGTMATDVSGKANWYQLLPGYKRFLVARLPAMAMPAIVAMAMLWPWPTLVAMAILAITVAMPVAIHLAKVATFRREIIEPVAMAVATVTKTRHAAGRGHGHVAIPRDFRDKELATMAIGLPAGWIGDPGDKARITTAVANRLQLEDIVATWQLHGSKPRVTFALPAKPPKQVSFADGQSALAGLTDAQLAMGLGAHSPETFDLGIESPHLLIAGGSGAGKSELIAWIVGQFMRRGYGVVVLDAKFISHMWLRRVPGVAYAAETEELHESLLWLDNELLRRARFVAAGGDPDTLVPLVAVLEEMNGATNRLRQYWKNELDGKGMSPALTALGNLSSMGRELRIHVVMAGQSMTSKATGGVENRENFGGRALARATANQWRMLAPQIKPIPKRSHPGRWHLVVGDMLKEFQVPFCDLKNESARLIEWATSGKSIPDVPAMMAGQVVVPDQEELQNETTTTCTLPEYAAGRGLDLKRMENWRSQRRTEFPASRGKRGVALLYCWEDLDAFVAQRLREPVEDVS